MGIKENVRVNLYLGLPVQQMVSLNILLASLFVIGIGMIATILFFARDIFPHRFETLPDKQNETEKPEIVKEETDVYTLLAFLR